MSVRLPDAARTRLITLAANRLPAVPAAEVPVALRRFVSFAPARRAQLAAGALATTLENDAAFRGHVAEALKAAEPELAAAVLDGTAPPAAAPADVAVAAYLLRPDGWESLVATAATELEQAAAHSARSDDAAAASRLQADLETSKREGRATAEKLRAELAAAPKELAGVRGQRKAALDVGRRTAAELTAARDAADATAKELATARDLAARAERRDKSARAELEADIAALRAAAREVREYDDVKLRVLLDTVLAATRGLQVELALAPSEVRPGDRVPDTIATEGTDPTGAPGRPVDDPASLATLLAVGGSHLVVDGYNVTKTGYGDVPLEAQRTRLLNGLTALNARTGVEVTCVFDGATTSAAVRDPSRRGVRVRFSQPGHTADEVIAAFVRAEPTGRPLVVVSSDGEVVSAARRAGATPVPSATLLALLGG